MEKQRYTKQQFPSKTTMHPTINTSGLFPTEVFLCLQIIGLRWKNSFTRTIDFLPSMKSHTILKLKNLLGTARLKKTKAGKNESGLDSFFFFFCPANWLIVKIY